MWEQSEPSPLAGSPKPTLRSFLGPKCSLGLSFGREGVIPTLRAVPSGGVLILRAAASRLLPLGEGGLKKGERREEGREALCAVAGIQFCREMAAPHRASEKEVCPLPSSPASTTVQRESLYFPKREITASVLNIKTNIGRQNITLDMNGNVPDCLRVICLYSRNPKRYMSSSPRRVSHTRSDSPRMTNLQQWRRFGR